MNLSALDAAVLLGALAVFVLYGLWRGRKTRDLQGYLLADHRFAAWAVALSVMATQAGPVTFLSTPGQGFADGLRFVQFYFGLPFAMLVLGFTAVPAYARMKVYTAYEFLEGRFDGRTRTLAAALFLLQRGLSAGITLYAPALVLSVLLGWNVGWTCALLGVLAVAYAAWGGSRSVGEAHVLQFSVIMGAMALAFVLVLRALPHGATLGDATTLARSLGRLNPIQTRFDWNDRYNLWSGLIGGFFLQLSYFGADQSQVGRYLGGRSVRDSRLGLFVNGIVKVPMQYGILFLGVMVAVFYLFTPAPLFFNPVATEHVASGPFAPQWRALDARHAQVAARTAAAAEAFVHARHAHDAARVARATAALAAARADDRALRGQTAALIQRADPGAQTSDTNYVFLWFVLHVLPRGVVGLVLAAIFAASMNSSSSELNALASTSMVDVVRRVRGPRAPQADVRTSRWLTVGWMAFAVGFAEYASRLGSLIEAVNILGSLFYGTILGMFVTAFALPRVGGRAVCAGAVIAEAAVLACFHYTTISFLWYNALGCLLVMAGGLAFSFVWPRENVALAPAARPAPETAGA
ncbi:MAG TPA: sodium:solute symporter [Gemmatimonadales bacterium]|nr:sodium:solute symporter [Gemmatimonadales bacterium]